MSQVRLRSVTAQDDEFCFHLHKAAMGEYVAAIWGWDEIRQREFHDRSFGSGRWQIITIDDVDAGILGIDLDHVPGQTYLGRIEIHPDRQGKGVGSGLIRGLQAEAHGRGQHVVLDVLTVNHRAQALYQRLGFAEIARHGDNNAKIRMKCCEIPPPAPAQKP